MSARNLPSHEIPIPETNNENYEDGNKMEASLEQEGYERRVFVAEERISIVPRSLCLLLKFATC